MSFRKLPKVVLQTMVPVEVAEKVGHLAVTQGRPDNETVTRLLCVGLGIDPSRYGIDSPPERKRRQPATSN